MRELEQTASSEKWSMDGVRESECTFFEVHYKNMTATVLAKKHLVGEGKESHFQVSRILHTKL